jgi:ribulose-phosphate 3-epimerase
MGRKLIAPSLLAADFSKLEAEIRAVESAGADMLHLDVMDGHFVPNISFGPPVISAIRSLTRLPFDTHLMIENPEQYLEQFRSAGSDMITVHQEASGQLRKTLARIKELGAKVGVALNPSTSLDLLHEFLEDVDLILIMSVHPGFGGQKFIPQTLQRLEEVSKMIARCGRRILLEVDGGIDASTAQSCSSAGADVFVAGTSIFRQPDRAKALLSIRMAVEKA